MSGKVDFRNYGNAEISSISHYILDFFLCIESAIAGVVEFIPILADHGAVSPRAHFGKLRIFLDLDSPSLVLGKMPVEAVQFISSHDIEISLHLIDIEEMTCHVEMHSAVCESWLVLDGSAREHPILSCSFRFSIISSREHLSDGLRCIAETGNGRCLDLDSFLGNVNEVLFRCKFLIKSKFNAFSGSI